jgi:hypothetical protein
MGTRFGRHNDPKKNNGQLGDEPESVRTKRSLNTAIGEQGLAAA